ncbi:alpha/beta fold hydrolase [Paenibacillus sp. CC-CFT747]|nr:alpha/beta fold hydrolase [Paenibacillus sp. CC-CFT747]
MPAAAWIYRGAYEVHPLARHLHDGGWDCFTPTLPGHGGDLRKLKNVSRRDWLKAAEEEADKLAGRYGRFDLVGFSMGGLIAAYLANRYPVRRLVFLNAAVYYVSPVRLARDVYRQWRKGDTSYYRRKERTPLPAVVQFMRLVRELKPEFDEVTASTLIVQGARDQIVHPYSARYIHKRLKGDKELHFFPESRHIICTDVEAREVFTRVEGFLGRETRGDGKPLSGIGHG